MNSLSHSIADNLSRYMQEIQQYPMLTAKQERDLSRRWREDRDPEALDRLVGSHLRLVAKIARDNSGYGLPVDELISEGNIGLMQAAEKFDPERGFRFATYAMWWIRASMQEYVLRTWSLVKMGTTAAQKRLFFNLRRLKHRLQAIESGDLSPENVRWIARELGVPEEDVIQMNRRLAGPEVSLNAPRGIEDESERQDWLVDEVEDQETTLAAREELAWRRGLLDQAMTHLDERERHILTERRLREDPVTLEGLSRHYGISRERVRQLEVRAFQKVRKRMEASARHETGAQLAAA